VRRPIAPFLACVLAACTQTRVPATTVCQPEEPENGAACGLVVGKACSYTIPSVHTVICSCNDEAWGCGVPSGNDATESAAGCPASAPKVGETCRFQVPAAYPRPGCLYEVPATPIVHDCFCAHAASALFGEPRAVWDCKQRTGAPTPFDANGCPWVQPADDSQCTSTTPAACQYGYNLSTTCRCAPRGDVRAWRCETVEMPPSP
jgi:hypothetical protein